MKKFHEIHHEDGSVDDLFLMIEHENSLLMDITQVLDTNEFYQYVDNKFKKINQQNSDTSLPVYQKCPWYEAVQYCGSIPCTDGALISHVVEYDATRKLVKTCDNVWWSIKNAAYSHTLSRLAIGDTVITDNVKKIRAGLYARDLIFDYSEVKEGFVTAVDFSKGIVQVSWNGEKETVSESIANLICVKKYNGQVVLPVYFNQKKSPRFAA